ncbi:hypothetical protein KOW79_014277 [Hemibagrus wyckioides]|uniref:LRAT domain-containing protein n=1 Tax=Hemibagrus wyckioides TaxID=337641 RepID=A0A9D3NGA4_9TELE|nr:hypothetical protein KOW79_014277 [Hemibagrus wyckioides]
MEILGVMSSSLESFIGHQSLAGLGYEPTGFSVVKPYDHDYSGNSETGDLFIVKANVKGLYHAGVYYDKDLIVHFTKTSSESSSSGSSSSHSMHSSPTSSGSCPGSWCNDTGGVILNNFVSRYCCDAYCILHTKAASWDNWMTGLGYDPEGFSLVKHYDDDYNGNSDIGDLFIVKADAQVFYHAGVYYDKELIVHFMSQICFDIMERFSGGEKFAIYRKKYGVSEHTIKQNVIELMRKELEYDFFNYNCIHFAMEVLSAASSHNWMIGLGYDPEGFSLVKNYDDDYNGNSDIGDLFIVKADAQVFYHAGVYYDKELIVHFMKKSTESSSSSSSSFSMSSSPNSFRYSSGHSMHDLFGPLAPLSTHSMRGLLGLLGAPSGRRMSSISSSSTCGPGSWCNGTKGKILNNFDLNQ